MVPVSNGRSDNRVPLINDAKVYQTPEALWLRYRLIACTGEFSVTRLPRNWMFRLDYIDYESSSILFSCIVDP